MQIGSSTAYIVPQPIASAARPLSADVTPDLARSDLAPAVPAQEAQADNAASSREEADQAPARGEAGRSEAQLRQEQAEISELSQRDREVRAHEQAHAAVGGQHAGAPTYSFKRGPDGQRYAISGEVGIDVSPVPNDPAATLQKMETVRRAALAPAEPSGQDLSVAAQAQAQAAQARVELAQLRREEASQTSDAEQGDDKGQDADGEAPEAAASSDSQQAGAAAPSLELYRRIGAEQTPTSSIDQIA